MHISFVILHYLTEKDTVECVNSIYNNVDSENYSIIIVDNCSPNNSGIRLKKMYAKEKRIEVILNPKNLGFARGNNVGFTKAKYEYKSDFIILMNNDMYIKQKDFIKKIINSYKNINYAVMGPDIISVVDNQHQNPQPIRVASKNDARYQLFRHIFLFFINSINLEIFVRKIFKKVNGNPVPYINSSYRTNDLNVQLHGSCLIFSPIYLQKFNGLYDKTFMYFEEDILFYLCQKNNLMTFYNSELQIFHKEDSATNEYLKNSSHKNRFIYKNSINSIIELLKLM